MQTNSIHGNEYPHANISSNSTIDSFNKHNAYSVYRNLNYKPDLNTIDDEFSYEKIVTNYLNNDSFSSNDPNKQNSKRLKNSESKVNFFLNKKEKIFITFKHF